MAPARFRLLVLPHLAQLTRRGGLYRDDGARQEPGLQNEVLAGVLPDDHILLLLRHVAHDLSAECGAHLLVFAQRSR